MNSILIAVLVATFGVVAFVVDRLPKQKSGIVGVVVSLPAMIYFFALAVTQSVDDHWAAWLFFFLASGILLKSVREIIESRSTRNDLNSPR